MQPHNSILNQVDNYYSSKIEKFGLTPQGVDWNSAESQTLRFDVLSTVINPQLPFSVLDYGCGFGSMFGHFTTRYQNFTFTGFDISKKMIDAATEKYGDNVKSKWVTELPTQKHDYVIASGIFNVKLENTTSEWETYILNCLEQINNLSDKGFSFNALTKYSDKEYMKDYLHYADPLVLFDYCKRHFSRNVALLHDYNLYEFTILVRK